MVVCPIGRRKRGYPTRIEVEPGPTGMDVSASRMARRLGSIDDVAVFSMERVLRLLLRL
jgi:mRNA-degrading endonuclease toxin of MazEF toxin-antitoxin module